MYRKRIAVFVVCLFWFFLDKSCAEICGSVDVRSETKQFSKLKNCTKINGNLWFVLLDNITADDYTSFPNLVEVRDYVVVFDVKNLISLRLVFPNLRLIRGVEVFQHYSLIIFDNPELEEIGLTSLTEIQNGKVIVGKCPNLCYVNTIDWKGIGAAGIDFEESENQKKCLDVEKCNHCTGNHCWNSETCQVKNDGHCHKQCFGCSQSNSSRHCNACKKYDNAGECVEECPADKFSQTRTFTCLTKEECLNSTNLKKKWRIFEDKEVKQCRDTCPPPFNETDNPIPSCKYAGETYRKNCIGSITVDSVQSAHSLYQCTHIFGSVTIKINDQITANRAEITLAFIREIHGCLIVSRSGAITNLEFLKRLKVIHGVNCTYKLFVFENQNLQKLWNFTENFTLALQNGDTKICTIGFHDNPQLCPLEIKKLMKLNGDMECDDMNVSPHSNGDGAICSTLDIEVKIVELNATNVTLQWTLPNIDMKSIVGYVLYFALTDTINQTTLDSDDVCSKTIWDSVYILTNNATIYRLSPYKNYSYYIKIHRKEKSGTTIIGEASMVKTFRTKSSDPSQPRDFRLKPLSNTRINISWLLPDNINGKLSYYKAYLHLQKDDTEFLKQRNYCDYPHDYIDANPIKPRDKISKCRCDPKIHEENMLEETSWCYQNKDSRCDIFKYHVHQDSDEIIVIKNASLDIEKRRSVKKSIHTMNKMNIYYKDISIQDLTKNYYEVGDLESYSLYTVLFEACNEEEGSVKLCSSSIFSQVRTLKNESADIILKYTLMVDKNEVHILWDEPFSPNSATVAFRIESDPDDNSTSKINPVCIPQKEFSKKYRSTKFGYKYGYKMQLPPGTYGIRLQAVSLAGRGPFVNLKSIYIAPESVKTWVIYIVVLIVVIVCIGFYFWYKKKFSIDDIHLIASINPDYDGSVYVPDEWEISRSDVDLLDELGHGTFGLVYNGYLKTRKIPCAVKTVTENASLGDCQDFLNEAAVMKVFSQAHHVVKLLGIVSKGQPPLVLMELMERGDLKAYLRNSRESSQSITSNELYLMAAQIADGMAYLTAKKFVHRDLAARNCMVAADYTVKIGDFGMTRDIYQNDYYRKDSKGLMPVRWMAPESLADGIFTSDSDVWSYGVILWEMATLGEQPYQGLANEQVLNFIISKGKLGRPPSCPNILYEIMDSCWATRPRDRSCFIDIIEKLEPLIGEAFRLVSFFHSREGEDYRMNNRGRTMLDDVNEHNKFGYFSVPDETVSLCAGNEGGNIFPSSYQKMEGRSAGENTPSWHSSYAGGPSSSYS